MTKAVSNFLFAQRQVKQQRQPQRQDANAGKTAELQQKGEMEWCRIEKQAQEKLTEIKQARLTQVYEKTAADSPVQMRRKNFEAAISREFSVVMGGLSVVLQQEKDYQRCSYRRTACKALDNYIMEYNLHRRSAGWEEHKNFCRELQSGEKWDESGRVTKYRFDQFGEVAEIYGFLVDPGRFWSYDLVRSKNYGERPL